MPRASMGVGGLLTALLVMVPAGGTYLWAWKGNARAGTATDARRNLYPIPASECVANPNLKGIGRC